MLLTTSIDIRRLLAGPSRCAMPEISDRVDRKLNNSSTLDVDPGDDMFIPPAIAAHASSTRALSFVTSWRRSALPLVATTENWSFGAM